MMMCTILHLIPSILLSLVEVTRLTYPVWKKISLPLTSSKSLHFACVNARSVKNKTADIVDHVIGNAIDACIVTEDMVKEPGFS